MKKAITAVCMACAMIAETAVPAFASQNKFVPEYSYTNNGYTFEKISHAGTATEKPDGVVDYLGNGDIEPYVYGESEEGKGNRVQSYSYCAAAYGDWIYIGTMYGALSAHNQISRAINKIEGIPEGFPDAVINAMYNGRLNKGKEDDDYYMGSIFFKMNVKTGETKVLMSREMYNDGECAGVPIFRSAAEYNDKLYFVGIVSDGSALRDIFIENGAPEKMAQSMAMNTEITLQAGIPCIYELNPETDELKEVYRCVDSEDYLTLLNHKIYDLKSVFTSTRAIGTYKDYLIAGGIQKGRERENGYAPGEAVILATNDPAQENFSVIATMDDLFDYPAIWRDGSSGGGGIYQVVEFNDDLYVAIVSGDASTKNEETGQFRPFAIVKGEYDENVGEIDDRDAWTWTPLVGDLDDGAEYTFGIDPERTSSSGCTLQVYGDYLYIGEYNDVNGSLQSILTKKSFTTLLENLEDSINLYRMDKKGNIELVVGDATKMFPEGGISGVPSGYNTNMSQYTWMTNVFDDVMYLSLMDESSLLRPVAAVASGEWLDMSKEEWLGQLNYLRVLIELLIPEKEEPYSADISAAVLSDDMTENEEEKSDSSVMSRNDALALLRNAVLSAEGRYAVKSALSLDDEEDTELYLTEKQMDSLVEGLMEGKIGSGLVNEDEFDTLLEINGYIGMMAGFWDEEIGDGFLDAFTSMTDLLLNIADDLPEFVRDSYDELLDNKSIKTIYEFAKCYSYMMKSEAGFDLVAIKDDGKDGVEIETVTTNGFDDRYNHGLRVFANTDDYMAIGTANPFYGTQIWRMSEHPENETAELHKVNVIGGKGDGKYESGEKVKIKAENKKEFSKWVVLSGNVELKDSRDFETTFIMPDEDVVVAAVYGTDLPDLPIIPHIPDFGSDSGHHLENAGSKEYYAEIINGDGDGNYKAGKTVEITADKENFVKWNVVSGDAELEDEKNPETSFRMPAENVTIEAVYETKDEKPEKKIVLTINDRYIYVNDVPFENDVAPIIRNSRTFIPARAVAENLGAKVIWNEELQQVTVISDEVTIVLTIGSDRAFVNGQEVVLDTAPFIENGRTYTPARFIAENLGAKVMWNEALQQVIITK